jgi:hypothetical protein
MSDDTLTIARLVIIVLVVGFCSGLVIRGLL